MIATIKPYINSQELATKPRIKPILTKTMKDYTDVQKLHIDQIEVRERMN